MQKEEHEGKVAVRRERVTWRGLVAKCANVQEETEEE
jgi:hypothetical protein